MYLQKVYQRGKRGVNVFFIITFGRAAPFAFSRPDIILSSHSKTAISPTAKKSFFANRQPIQRED
jgi:hypothetical protein